MRQKTELTSLRAESHSKVFLLLSIHVRRFYVDQWLWAVNLESTITSVNGQGKDCPEHGRFCDNDETSVMPRKNVHLGMLRIKMLILQLADLWGPFFQFFSSMLVQLGHFAYRAASRVVY